MTYPDVPVTPEEDAAFEEKSTVQYARGSLWTTPVPLGGPVGVPKVDASVTREAVLAALRDVGRLCKYHCLVGQRCKKCWTIHSQ